MSDLQQKTLRTILGGVPGLLALKNDRLAYEVANPRFCQFVGKAPGEIAGKTDADLFPAAEAQESEREDRAVMQSGMPRRCEQAFTGTGGRQWFEVCRSAILDDNGDAAGVFLYAYEITSFKKREEEFSRAETRQAELHEEIAAARTAAQRAQEALQSRETELAELQGRLTGADARAAELETQRATARQDAEAMGVRVAELETQYATARQDAEASNDRARVLEEQSAALGRDLDAAREKLARSEAENAVLVAAQNEAAALAGQLIARLKRD